jgi:hypothetical protein
MIQEKSERSFCRSEAVKKKSGTIHRKWVLVPIGGELADLARKVIQGYQKTQELLVHHALLDTEVVLI